MSKKNILVLTHNFIRSKEDDAGQFIFTLTRERRDDFEVFVLAPHQKGTKTYEEIENLRIFRFRNNFPRFEKLAYKGNMHEQVFGSFLSKVNFLFFLLAFFLYALTTIEKHKIELLHCHWWIPAGVIGYLVFFFVSIPIVLTTYGSDVFILRKFRWVIPLARLIFREAAFVTAVSASLKQLIISELRIWEEEIFVFPMPVDIERFYPLNVEQPRQRKTLSIGRLIQRKAHEYLLRACNELKEEGMKFDLTIIGSGPEKDNLIKLAKSLGLEKDFTVIENLPQNELKFYYNSCDFFVLASIVEWKKEEEGLGLVFLEAMACKLGVIGTKTGGIVDIVIHEKIGLLVPEKDISALPNAMKRYLLDENLKTIIAEEGYNFVPSNFTPQAISKKLKAFYRRVDTSSILDLARKEGT